MPALATPPARRNGMPAVPVFAGPQQQRRQKRGGAAAGSPDYYDPSSTAYDELPPSSTYKSGPQIAGSTGGFYGLLFGLIVVAGAAFAGFCLWRRRRRRLEARSALDDSIYPSAKGAGIAGLGSKKAWGKHQELAGEDDGLELRGSAGKGAWASTASVNLQPGDESFGRYKDNRFAESGESLTFDASPTREIPDYHPVHGGQLSSLDLRPTSPSLDVR